MKTKTTLKILTTALLISLFAAKTNAQIVYVDIDPDTTIYVPDVPWNVNAANHFYFDLNQNDTMDFQITAHNYYVEWGGAPQYGKSLYIRRCTNIITSVAGICGDGGYREDVFLNDTINHILNWGEVKFFRFFLNDATYSCDLPINDAYIGLFIIEDTDTLYGWVRCTATNSSITIKDYAYNTIPNMHILAGKTELGIGNFAQSPNINIYENSGYLNVNITYPSQVQGHVRIYSQQGVLVKADNINGQQNIIALAGIVQGIYVVQVTTQTDIVNKQIFLQGN